jgi:GntR family transcriptional regulator, phosphonate transport system regulatory protein
MTTRHRSTSGYSTWRLIAEELRRDIVNGGQAPGTRLPSEGELAGRFGVHRNTVRQAVAALAAEHLVVSRRGSGTFVADHALRRRPGRARHRARGPRTRRGMTA